MWIHIGDSQEIVVKPLGQQLIGLNCYAGATIMGDGKIALILDVMGLGLRSGVIGVSGEPAQGGAEVDVPAVKEELLHSLLLCRAGSFQRLGIPLAQVARLEKIPAASVEPAAGRAAVQYRQRILPLLDAGEMLGGVAASDPENLHVVVCRCAGAEFGLVVDEITDIVEEAIGDLYPAGPRGPLGLGGHRRTRDGSSGFGGPRALGFGIVR